MKVHTNEFKENIHLLGRELDRKITYTIDGSEYELSNEELNSVTPHYKSAILKSTMRQLDLEVKENTNLFNINGVVNSSLPLIKYKNGLTLIRNTNRFVKLWLPKTLQAGTYTFNFDLVHSNITNDRFFGVSLQYNNEGNVKTFYPIISKTFTIDKEFNQIYFYINSSESDTTTITIDNIMLTESDFPQPFEKYNKLIDGDAKGTILNYKFGVKVRDGKNLFNKKGVQTDITGANLEELETGIRATMTTNGNYRRTGILIPNVQELLGKTVTLSATITPSGTNNGRLMFYEIVDDHAYEQSKIKYGLNTTGSITVKMPDSLSENSQGIALLFYGNTNSDSANIGDYVDYTNVQLEIGNTATSYENYGAYDYINYGNYVVKDIEKQEDTYSYKITCYDKMLYSMIDYVNLNVTYPITIRNYLNAICNYLGLTFKNANDTFANYNKQIPNELYIDSDGKSLGYTFRDVLDELAQVTASTICINEEDDELEIRYINQTVGKNLLNPNRLIQTAANGITCSYDKDTQIITFNGTCTTDNTTFYFHNSVEDISEVISGLTTLTAYYVSGSVDTYFQWRINNSDWSRSKSYNLLNIANDKIISNTSNVSFDLANSSFSFRFDNGSVVNNLKIKIMVANDLDTTYEPYGDTIDEEFLKDVNVNFGEKYGSINTIVLSRSAGADNIYYPSTLPTNPVEIKISDNQIMNGNNRADFMQEIYNKLNGLEYYINDYTSPGICYYNVCDRYNVMIGDTFYSCVMFNDEVNVTQGLEENVYTDLPEESVTDYTKADKDDRRLNQTILMVDKQNGVIQSLVEKVVDISNTITGNISIQLENAHPGGLHKLVIYGDVRPLFPSTDIYPSSTTYTRDTYLLIDDKEYKLDFDILRYYSLEKHDEFVYEDGECRIIRRVGVNSSGQMYPLTNDVVEEREGVFLEVNSNSTIKLKSFDNAFYTATYLLENEYTDNFASQVDVKSQITQTNNKIEATVSQVADEDGEVTAASILLAVNKDESEAKIQADKIELEGYTTINGNFKIDENGDMEVNNGTFNGLINAGKIEVKGYTEQNPYIEVGDLNSTQPYGTAIWDNGITVADYRGSAPLIRTEYDGGYAELYYGDVNCSGHVTSIEGVCQGSLEEIKKDFEKLESGLDIIKNIDIYKYRYKKENDTKKHIGLVIGNNYKYSKEVTNNENNAIDLYSFVAVCCKAIQEQQEEIENLKKEMEEIKNAKD